MNVQQLLARLRELDIKLWVEGEKLRYSAPQGVLTDELLDEFGSHKKELMEWLNKVVSDNDKTSSVIEMVSRDHDLPTSYAQERLLFLEQLVPETNSYNLLLAVRLKGDLDTVALEQSLNDIVVRHESLRTRFVNKNGQHWQVIDQEQEIKVLIESVSDNAEALRLVEEETYLPFDFNKGPLIRCKLFKISDQEHIIVLTLHHIVCDGWSLGLLFKELSDRYSAYSDGEAAQLPELSIQYADYAAWQREILSGEALEDLLAYWRDKLNGITTLQLPIDHPRPLIQSFEGGIDVIEISSELAERLKNLSEEQEVTLFMTLLTTYMVLLHRYCGQDDIAIGTPVANRNRIEVEAIIGFFVNMLVLRADLAGNPSFRELLSKVKEVALGAYQHQELPFEKLVSDLRTERDLGRNPLFQVAFALQNAPLSPVQLKGLNIEPLQQAGKAGRVGKVTTRFDLEFNVFESEKSLAVVCCYNKGLFEASTIGHMLAHYQQLLESIVSDSEQNIDTIQMLTQDERDLILHEWNRTETEYRWEQDEQPVYHQLVHRQVASQAERLPQQAAVIEDGCSLSYQELNEDSNRLAHHLIESGVAPGKLVAVLLERSPELIIAQLAVLKAGAAYVSIDPEYPIQRLAYILNDTAAPVLLTQSSLQFRVTDYPGEQLLMDRREELLQSRSADLPEVQVGFDDLAYVIYTSGSTGEPKGVEVTHQGLFNLVSWHRQEYQVDSSDRATHLAGLGFDASVWELWPYITSGASLYLVPDQQRLEANGLWAWMAERGITLSFLATPLAEAALQTELPEELSLKALLTGGDLLHAGLVDRPLPFRLVNHYGPTENTVIATCTEVDVSAEETPPIGRPIGNVQTYILDAYRQPVPIGVVGELYIGGDSLARGYLNQSELTEEKFVPNPFSNEEGARLYRSGDLVCYREDGRIEFIGRVDQQVKIRGFRIELGEIESVVCRQDGVQAAVVLVQEDEQDIKRLVAYIVFDNNQTRNIDEIRYALQEELPVYMLPSAFVVLDELPLTTNGKFDRDALPSVDIDQIAIENYLPPSGELETRIAAIWSDLLGLEKVGARDIFFDLGGHSLLMSRVQARLSAELDRKIPMLDLFQYPTIESLARHLSGEKKESPVIENARLRMQKRNRASADENGEAIAIIGMAGRFPGAASIEQFWENLANGVEGIKFYTDEELLAVGVPEKVLAHPSFVPARGYLDDVELFDAAFFAYPPREAELLDPQQRVFLECAWEVLERAGYDPERFPGLIGVYAGANTNTYMEHLKSHQEVINNYRMQMGTSNFKDYLPTRVSFKLNLRGPSFAIQTACATSLVAVHEASKSLLGYECDIALAGGASILTPRVAGYFYEEGNILSPDGHCRALSADAGGTVSGEGVGIVALKRLSEAQRDGDLIHAVIRGSAITNDGSNKVGFTAPSVEGQVEVIALAYAAAGISPDSISYIETHGTGTKLGDPIELTALDRVFAESNRSSSNKCALGALKASIGHLDVAAGVSSIIKTTLALEHRQIPPSLNYSAPNPEFDFDSGPFFVNTELRPWETEADSPLRAGVSAFGIGGTNVHAVLEQAPPREESGLGRPWQLIPISAKNEVAMDQSGNRIADYLEQNPDAKLADVSFTLRVGRGQFDFRRAVICHDHETAIAGLRGSAGGQSWSNSDVTNSPAVIFMFPGQGAQYVAMGQGLYETEALFRDIVDDCCEQLKRHIDIDLRETLFSSGDEGEAQLRRTLVTQCSLFVIEYALARLWMSWGIQPAAMIGHSIGEYVAACIAGVMELEEALSLIASRGQAMEQAPAGAMLSVALPEPEVNAYLSDGLWLSVINGRSICVVSGTVEAIDALEQRLGEDGVDATRLNTSGAFHSGLMDEVVPQLVAAAGKLKISSPQIPYISNVSGRWVNASQLRDAGYWGRHLRETVRFADGVDALLEKYPAGVFLEVGPGKSLSSMLRQSASEHDIEVDIIASLRHPREKLVDEETLMRALAELWLGGVEIDWSAYDQPARRCRVELPTYPFQRQRYWLEKLDNNTASQAVTRQSLQNWFYIPSWKGSMFSRQQVTDVVDGRWLIFCDHAGLSENIKHWLQSVDNEVVFVLASDGFARQENGDYQIDPANADDYWSLIDSLQQDSRLPDHVIHSWAVTPFDDAGGSADFLNDPLVMCYHSLIYLAQALGRSGSTDAIDISVLTNKAHTVLNGDELYPEKATLLGPCGVIGQEYSNLSCRNIEIEISEQGSDIDTLMTEILHPTDEMVVAYRNGQRWVKTYEAIALDEVNLENLPIRHGGVYLITGGLGGIGLALSNFLAQEYQAKLVLTGRSELPPRESWPDWLARENGSADPTAERIRAVQALEQHGAEVLLLQADAVDRERMREVVDLARDTYGEINGVIHSAGLPGGRVMQLQTAEIAEAVMAPKLEGTRIIGDLCSDMPLDFMVLCSSLAAVLGVAGQVDYCSANAFQDAYADFYSAKYGIPAIAINWDAWNESGMAVNAVKDQGGNEYDLIGVGFNHSEGVEAFKRILARSTVPQMVVTTYALLPRMPKRVIDIHSQKEAELEAENAEISAAAAKAKYERPQLKTSYVEPSTEVEKTICQLWQKLLGIEGIGIDDDFFELGGHSLLATRVVANLRTELDLELSLEGIFEAPTIRQLAALVDSQQGTDEPVVQEDQLAQQIKQMTPDQRDQLLSEARSEKA